MLKFITSVNFFGEQSTLQTSEDCDIVASNMLWGFDQQYFTIIPAELKQGQILSDLIASHEVTPDIHNQIISNVSEFVNLNSLKTGAHYAFVHSNVCSRPDYFIYHINPYQYVVADLNQNGCCQLIDRPQNIKREMVGGVIQTNLWDALQEQGVSLSIIDQMEDALSSSLDFHHVQTGNNFKLIFDRNYVEDEPTNEGKLIAAYFNANDKDHMAFRYAINGKEEYYDLAGRPMRRSFLQAPVRFSRISSPFSFNRFHPVLKYHRAHLGTDYAAPYGTPILAVGDGTIESASYSRGNGNFVKIKHNKIYQTQYLHMSRFANHIKSGKSVKQGEVIGYVGSTGLASGPHVCFRFWKNGVQVNHRRLHFPNPDPLPQSILPEYFQHRDSILAEISKIQFSTAQIRSKHKTT